MNTSHCQDIYYSIPFLLALFQFWRLLFSTLLCVSACVYFKGCHLTSVPLLVPKSVSKVLTPHCPLSGSDKLASVGGQEHACRPVFDALHNIQVSCCRDAWKQGYFLYCITLLCSCFFSFLCNTAFAIGEEGMNSSRNLNRCQYVGFFFICIFVS